MVKTRNQLRQALLLRRSERDGEQHHHNPVSAPRPNQFQLSRQNTTKTKNSEEERTTTTMMKMKKTKMVMTISAHFLGPPFSSAEAMARWPHRYASCSIAKSTSEDVHIGKQMALEMVNGYIVSECKAHYARADVDGCTYELDDYVTINCDCDTEYAGQIVEFFETPDKECWLTTQWMFRPEDTVIGMDQAKHHDKRRLFHSNESDVIPLETIMSKIKVLQVAPSLCRKQKVSTHYDFYFDMGYSYDYSTFYSINPGNITRTTPNQEITKKYVSITDSGMITHSGSDRRITRSEKSTRYSDSGSATTCIEMVTNQKIGRVSRTNTQDCAASSRTVSLHEELSLLDIYSGCGGLSAGLCMGACFSGINIATRWAVDINEYACESFKLNHPHAEVRNEAAEDFFCLIKEWKKLCDKYSDSNIEPEFDDGEDIHGSSSYDNRSNRHIEYEVEKINGIRWLDPTNGRKKGLEFKIHWKGYSKEEDSWEPLYALKNCMMRLKDFVLEGIKKKILPLPGDVDVVCGGPPCQGISGLNRFRNTNAPLEDPKNQQTVVFMDIVEFLKPRFVILENVVDILRFSNGFLGRYALSRIVQMHYQARLGLLVAGCYGLPQFRMRFFLLGASPFEVLPAFPLPTHNVLMRGTKPSEWEWNVVAYNENSQPKLNDAVLLKDAISDLPPVKNTENREKLRYTKPPLTPFQKFMRSPLGANTIQKMPKFVQDHRPLVLNQDNFERMSRIPKRKGANFTDLPGIKKLRDGTVELDPNKRIILSSGKHLVPKYALNHFQANSTKPFGRLWWDEIIPTLTTRPTPYARAIIHPTQDRVLSIRECARVQGFADDYKFCGPVKERYRQIGNAVAIPVAKALGYSLGLAMKKHGQNADKGEFELPLDFAFKSSNESSMVEAPSVGRRNLTRKF